MPPKDWIASVIKRFAKNTKDRRARIIAQILAARSIEALRKLHLMPADNKRYLAWVESLPPAARFALKYAAYSASGFVHALPNGHTITSLFPAEVISDLFIEAGMATTGIREREKILARALPVAAHSVETQMLQEPSLRQLLIKIFGSLDEYRNMLDQTTTGIQAAHQRYRASRHDR